MRKIRLIVTRCLNLSYLKVNKVDIGLDTLQFTSGVTSDRSLCVDTTDE